MTVRRVEPITVPAGAGVLGLLPHLRRALTGDGPALLPIGAHDPRAGDLAAALGAGEALGPGEDDAADPTALVMPTSGSTATPKGVLLSAGNLAASAAATETRLGGPGTWLLALPAEHIAGMQVLLRAARAGTEPIVMDREKPFTAADFAALARTLPGPRRYVSLVPTQLRRVLADAASTVATADVFDAVLVGGAAAPPDLLRTARAAGIPVVTTYGMTETCGGCVYNGVPLAGVTATVNAAGAVVLSGPVVARGYRGRPNDPAFATAGSFVTSDTGEIRAAAAGSTMHAVSSDSGAAARLVVTGRLDEMIISGGINVAPAPVEAAISALPGIVDALVVGLPDERWGAAVTALVVPEAHGPMWTLDRLREALTGLPPAHRPTRLAVASAIPLLPSGKPDRRAARDLALRGGVPPRR